MITKILMGYAVFMILGGFIGYKKAGSKMSLIMGVISCGIIFLGLYVAQSNQNVGYCIISGMAAMLTVVFFIRVLKTKSFMPSGMLFLLSLSALILIIIQLPAN